MTKKIVLTTFGSLGDLHPFVALAIELKARGHAVAIAANGEHRRIVEAERIAFHAIRPSLADFGDETAIMQKVMDLKAGPEFLLRQMLLPRIRASYEDLFAVCEGADLLVTHPLTFAGSLIAEQVRACGLHWASIAIAPSVFLSAYDPPTLAPVPWLNHFRIFGPEVYGRILNEVRRSIHSWAEPWHDFRRELGLPTSPVNPIFDGPFSPELVLATFSPLLAAPQPDWPPNTIVTGFPFYDRRGEGDAIDPHLEAFLESGDAPIVFTLGSSAVMTAGRFYAESAEAARRLGRRALLLVGRDPLNRPAHLPDGVFAFDYAPYSLVLPRAAAIVHQGGIGTTAQALRAGRPMLFVPFGFDQPNNARLVTKLGVAKTVPRHRYRAVSAATALRSLLTDDRYAQSAVNVARQVQSEDGTRTACDALETLFS